MLLKILILFLLTVDMFGQKIERNEYEILRDMYSTLPEYHVYEKDYHELFKKNDKDLWYGMGLSFAAGIGSGVSRSYQYGFPGLNHGLLKQWFSLHDNSSIQFYYPAFVGRYLYISTDKNSLRYLKDYFHENVVYAYIINFAIKNISNMMFTGWAEHDKPFSVFQLDFELHNLIN